MNQQVRYERIEFEHRGPKGEVLWISLANPAMKNALDERMQVELIDLLEIAGQDESIRCIVIRGAGNVFCSGGDIRAFDGMNPIMAERYATHRGEALQMQVERLRKPIVAAVDGWCLAGGTELALMCDFVYATRAAKFGLTEIKIGLLPGWGGLTRLPRAVGVRRAREMIYRGEIVGADQAHGLGLVNKLYDSAEQLYAEIEKVALEIAGHSGAAVRVARGVISESQGVSEQVAMALERGAIVYLTATPDAHEGVRAFCEKRPANFNQSL